MKKEGRVALGRLVMHQRERLMALEAQGAGILAYTIRNKREVKDAKDIFGNIPQVKPPAQMVEIAAKIIDQLEAPFDPSQFNDRYEDALRELIKEKEKGATVTAPAEPKEAEVIDLMEALKRSLGQTGGERRKAAPRKAASSSKSSPKSAAKKPAAKKPATKKRA
jgi:DNA end-binding protein Ku